MKGDIKPLFLYAGGKRRSLPSIAPYLQRTTTYVEPFFGAGAVFCYIVNLSRAKHYIINDIRPEIMDIYRGIRDDVQSVLTEYQQLVLEYVGRSSGGRELQYYKVRDEWKKQPSPAKSIFIFNTNYRGIYMVDSKTGVYNASSGHYIFENKNTLKFDKKNIIGWSRALSDAEILTGTYENIMVPENDALVFCDPPYRDTGFKYQLEFSDLDQIKCFNWCNAIAKTKTVSVILTNNDCGQFFSNLAKGAPVKILNYDISYSGGEATKSTEMVMVWNQKKSHLLK